jgi:hypothetical protein
MSRYTIYRVEDKASLKKEAQSAFTSNFFAAPTTSIPQTSVNPLFDTANEPWKGTQGYRYLKDRELFDPLRSDYMGEDKPGAGRPVEFGMSIQDQAKYDQLMTTNPELANQFLVSKIMPAARQEAVNAGNSAEQRLDAAYSMYQGTSSPNDLAFLKGIAYQISLSLNASEASKLRTKPYYNLISDIIP